MKRLVLFLMLCVFPAFGNAMDKYQVSYQAYSSGQQYGIKYKDDKKNLVYNRQKGFDYCKKKYFPDQNIAYYCALGVGSGIFNINMSFEEFKKTLEK